ncbi:hypothetical protein FKM82_010601 [Ascaphus truei]
MTTLLSPILQLPSIILQQSYTCSDPAIHDYEPADRMCPRVSWSVFSNLGLGLVVLPDLCYKYLNIYFSVLFRHFLNSTSRRNSLVVSSLTSVTEIEEHDEESIADLKETRKLSIGDNTQVSSITQDHTVPGSSKGSDSFTENVVHDGLATDVPSQPTHFAGKPAEERMAEMKPFSKETWIDFADFCKCFQTLYVFHKPNTYPYTYQKSDFKATDDRAYYYLFVDNLKPTEMFVSFSALVRWGDSASIVKGEFGLQKGLLTAEEFSWKSLLIGPVVLKIHTYVTKASMICLPPGRHVLRFTASSPLGHHIHLCSTVPFVFGDEETVMPYLDKESYSFMEKATNVMKSIWKVINDFSIEYELPKALKELELTHYPQQTKASHFVKAKEHFKSFNIALWHLMTDAMGNKVTHDMVFAFRAFTLDFTAIMPAESHLTPVFLEGKPEVPTSWQNRISTCLEETAAIKLQASWRRIYVRKCLHARKPGTKENASVKGTLEKLWTILEPNVEQHGVNFLRHLFKQNAASLQLYSCYDDEHCRISFADYTVTYPEQPPNSWFVVFREVFHVPEDMLIVPKAYITIPVSALHVINNDTFEEIPWVFNKVAPHIYTKNKKGYTFMAEAHTGELSVASGKWRLRLIGSCNPLPSLSRDAANSCFSVKEIRDYYIPNNKNIMFR